MWLQQVAQGDKLRNTSERQIALYVLGNFCEIFVFATEYSWRNKLHIFSLIWLCATNLTLLDFFVLYTIKMLSQRFFKGSKEIKG